MNSSPTTRTQQYRGVANQQRRAEFIYKNKNVTLSDSLNQIYLVKNERGEVNMVKYSINNCTCLARKNCEHFLECMLYNGIDIYKEYSTKNNALAKNLTKLKSNKNGNKSSGRKYRDNIPQLEPVLNCFVCKKDERKGYPGKYCCSQFQGRFYMS